MNFGFSISTTFIIYPLHIDQAKNTVVTNEIIRTHRHGRTEASKSPVPKQSALLI